jgi:hypothetical protein
VNLVVLLSDLDVKSEIPAFDWSLIGLKILKVIMPCEPYLFPRISNV